MPGQDQADAKKQNLHDLLGNGVQRIGQDALKNQAPFFDGATIPPRPGSVNTMPAADLATSVAVDTAMPICAWRSAGASLAPSPHIPTVFPFFWNALTRLNFPSG